jgi:hypothetical protein
MQTPRRWPTRDILALAVVALCALAILATLIRCLVGRSCWWCGGILGGGRDKMTR